MKTSQCRRKVGTSLLRCMTSVNEQPSFRQYRAQHAGTEPGRACQTLVEPCFVSVGKMIRRTVG